MGATTKTVDSTPQAVQGLRNNFIDYLQAPNPSTPARQAAQPQNLFIGATNTATGLPPKDSLTGRLPGGSMPQAGGGIAPGQGPLDGVSQPGGSIMPQLIGAGEFGTGGPNVRNAAGGAQPSRSPFAGAAGLEPTQRPGMPQAAFSGGSTQGSPGGNGQGFQYDPWNPSTLAPPPGTAYGNNSAVNTTPGQSPFDRMFAQMPPDMQRIVLGSPALVQAMQQARTNFTSGMPNVMADQIGTGFETSTINDQFGLPGGGTQLPDLNRGMIRDVSSSPIGAQQVGVTQTDSVDKLGGANSAFFQNMMAQLQPAFNQQRAEAIAAAKEASGNITGTGYANNIGGALNRSLGAEQATLADYATRGMQTEVQRQLQQAGLDLSGATANQGADLQANMSNQDSALRAALANQGADSSFINQLLQRGQLGMEGDRLNLQSQDMRRLAQTSNAENSLRAQDLRRLAETSNQDARLRGDMSNQAAWLDASRLGQQGEFQNINSELSRQTTNAGAINDIMKQQGNMDLQRLLAQYGMTGDINRGNANNYLSALQNLFGQQGEVVQSGGAGSFFGQLMSALPYLAML